MYYATKFFIVLHLNLRIDDEDFNSTAFTIVFPADEDAPSLTRSLNAPIPIVDDDINEADEQYFFAKLEGFDGVNLDSVIIERDFAMVVIGDNDGMLQDTVHSALTVTLYNNCHIADIRIGFALDVYEYFEPSSETMFTNVTLLKENNRVSEQTFRVGIVASDPTSVRPATLETRHSYIYDYRVGSVGQTFILRDLIPSQQTTAVAFFLNSDDIPEGTEGFVLTSEVDTYNGHPAFLPPLPTSTTAFQSTTVQIIDDDGNLLAERAQRGGATLSSCQLRFSIYVSIGRASCGQRSSRLPRQQNCSQDCWQVESSG